MEKEIAFIIITIIINVLGIAIAFAIGYYVGKRQCKKELYYNRSEIYNVNIDDPNIKAENNSYIKAKNNAINVGEKTRAEIDKIANGEK